ncbi:MAG: hypothetical protein ACKPKO_10225, partial [Candidatus Fonsibacter sp.]
MVKVVLRIVYYFRNMFNNLKLHIYKQKGTPHMVERMIRTFKYMLDKRIKPGMQWIYLIYPILFTYKQQH